MSAQMRVRGASVFFLDPETTETAYMPNASYALDPDAGPWAVVYDKMTMKACSSFAEAVDYMEAKGREVIDLRDKLEGCRIEERRIEDGEDANWLIEVKDTLDRTISQHPYRDDALAFIAAVKSGAEAWETKFAAEAAPSPR